MSAGVRLSRLEVDAYRGAGEKVDLTLTAPLNIVCGPNGSGKSTVATAIEWALYPVESALLRESGIDERRGWEVQHVHARRRPDVTLTLDADGQEISIRQHGLKGSSRVALPGACPYADFKHLVFVHQETIRDFLVGMPGPRQAAFSRLLGSGWVDDLASSMEKARRQLKCKDADARINQIERLLQAKMEEVRRMLDEEKRLGQELGLVEPWAEAGRKIYVEIGLRLRTLCERAGITAPSEPAIEPLASYPERLSRVLDSLRHTGPAQRHAELAGKRARLQAANSSWMEAVADWKKRKVEYQEAESAHGSLEEIGKKLEVLEQNARSFREQRAALDRKRAVVREAIGYFRNTEGADSCPVCETPAGPGLIDELDRRFGEAATEEEQTVRRELEGLAERTRALTESAENLRRLIALRAGAEKRGRSARKELETALESAPREDEDIGAVAALAIQSLDGELERLREVVSSWLSTIQNIESRGRVLLTVARLISFEDRIAKLGAVRESPDWTDMFNAHQRLSIAEQTLRLTGERTRTLAAQVAEGNLRRVAGPIRDVYRRLTDRADFPDVTIDTARKYEVGVGDESASWSPTAVLNTTDMNSLALAVVIGMSVEFRGPTGFDFLILDDPSQGMDAAVSERLAGVLSDLSGEVQLLVTTPDEKLLDALASSPRRKSIIRLAPRDPAAEAPSVRVASVEGEAWTN